MIYPAYKWGGGYTKSEVDTLLTGKADTSHTHTKSQITDFPTIPSKTSDLTNDSGFLTSHQDLSGYVPRSGGAVMTGDQLSKTNDTSALALFGGQGWGHGSFVTVYGINNPDGRKGWVQLHPYLDNSNSKDMMLYPNGTWTWQGTAVQITSDQRLKQQISNIDNALLDAWEDVDLVQFKYNDAVDQKGKDKARLHTGYVVQQIDEACQKHNIDISEYGLYCHEEYPERTEEVTIENEDGTTSKETKVVEEASEHYSLRYTEALIVECAFLRRENKRLNDRLTVLEELFKQYIAK